MAKEELTPKQEAFCIAYLELGDASKAYRKAYEPKTAKPESVNRLAKKLLDNVKIRSRISKLTEPAMKKAEVTIEYIVDNLVELVERCMQRAPVKVRQGTKMVQLKDKEGHDVWQFDSKGANTALSTLAKWRGMLSDKVELTGKDGAPLQIPIINIQFSKRNDAEAESS